MVDAVAEMVLKIHPPKIARLSPTAVLVSSRTIKIAIC
jgi:hypothetical protein